LNVTPIYDERTVIRISISRDNRRIRKKLSKTMGSAVGIATREWLMPKSF
jgi:hypothetical protein